MAEVAGRLVAQLICTDELVAALACTFMIARGVDGVDGVVCPLLLLTTPAQPTRPKLKIVILRTTVSS